MRPLGSCPELVVLQNCSCSNSISKLMPSRLHRLWTAMVGYQQSSFVIVLTDINTIRFGLYTLMMFEMLHTDLFTDTHLHKLRNCPDSHANTHTQTALSHMHDVDFVCTSCSFFIFPSFCSHLSVFSSWVALEENQQWLKTERPHREKNNVSSFNKMPANGQHNGWLAGKREEKAAK